MNCLEVLSNDVLQGLEVFHISGIAWPVDRNQGNDIITMEQWNEWHSKNAAFDNLSNKVGKYAIHYTSMIFNDFSSYDEPILILIFINSIYSFHLLTG